MTALQEIVRCTERKSVARADRTLSRILPRVDRCNSLCDRNELLDKARQAISVKIREMALVTAFQEEEGVSEKDLNTLGQAALKKVQDPSYIQSVAEFIYNCMGLREKPQYHPCPHEVSKETESACRRVLRTLNVHIEDDGSRPKNRQKPVFVGLLDFKFGDEDSEVFERDGLPT